MEVMTSQVLFPNLSILAKTYLLNKDNKFKPTYVSQSVFLRMDDMTALEKRQKLCGKWCLIVSF